MRDSDFTLTPMGWFMLHFADLFFSALIMQPRHVLLFLAATLIGCASMSPQECQYADWLEVGRSDAQRGYMRDHLARHRKSCAKAGYSVDAERYYSGYQRGLKSYCIGATAFSAARYGHDKPTQCTDTTVQSPDFGRAYQYGLRVRDQELSVNALQQELSELGSAVEAHELRLHEIESILNHEDLENYEAIALHEESKAIHHQLALDLKQIEALTGEFDHLQRELEQMIRKFQSGHY